MPTSLRYRNNVFDQQEIFWTPQIPELREKDIIVVNCFPPFPTNEYHRQHIVSHIETRWNHETSQLVFENVYEGHVRSCLIAIYKLITELNIPPSRVWFITAGVEAEHIHSRLYPDRTNRIAIKTINVWEQSIVQGHQNIDEPKFSVGPKERLFLSFNRMSRPHRIALLGLMYEEKLIDRSYYSFFMGSYGDPMRYSMMQLKKYMSEKTFNTIQRQILHHIHEFPLTLNVQTQLMNVNFHMATDDTYYRNSRFSLVTETFFFKNDHQDYDEESVFFSEKTFKPIIGKHPFLFLNRPHSLQYLRQMGYKTFAPYIDETYDTIENDELRLLAIRQEVVRLSSLSDASWNLMEELYQPIIEHNYRTLMSKRKTGYLFNARNL